MIAPAIETRRRDHSRTHDDRAVSSAGRRDRGATASGDKFFGTIPGSSDGSVGAQFPMVSQ